MDHYLSFLQVENVRKIWVVSSILYNILYIILYNTGAPGFRSKITKKGQHLGQVKLNAEPGFPFHFILQKTNLNFILFY